MLVCEITFSLDLIELSILKSFASSFPHSSNLINMAVGIVSNSANTGEFKCELSELPCTGSAGWFQGFCTIISSCDQFVLAI